MKGFAIALLIGAVLAMSAQRQPVAAASPDWKAVEQALGTSGQLQDGDVFRIGMPRSDLAVTVKGVPVTRPGPEGGARSDEQPEVM